MKMLIGNLGARLAHRRPARSLIYRLAQVATVALLLRAASASAAPSPTVLVLSVAEEGHQQASLRAQVAEFVQRAGARPLDPASLPPASRACEEPVCLGQLAESHRVQLILAARIERRSRHERLIDMWLFEAKGGSDQSERALCDIRDMKDCLTSLAGKLIAPQLDGGSPHEAPEPRPAEPPAAAPAAALLESKPLTRTRAPLERSARLPGWRLGLGVGLGTLALGALATAIGTGALQGSAGASGHCTPTGQEAGCAYNFMPLSTPSYVAAGVFAVGAVLSFSLPTARMPRPRKEKP